MHASFANVQVARESVPALASIAGLPGTAPVGREKVGREWPLSRPRLLCRKMLAANPGKAMKGEFG